MANRDLRITVKAAIDDFKAKFREVNADLSKTSTQLQKSTIGFKQLGEGLLTVGARLTAGVTLPIVGVAAAAVNAFGEIDALKRGLTVVAGSAEEAARQFEQFREVAKLPGLGLQEALRAATQLQATGLFNAAQSERILRSFGNALASVGRGREDLGEVIRQLTQLAARGKVTADNLKPILERVPQAAGIIRREFGTLDTEVLQKMGVDATRLIDVLLRELDKIPPVTGGIKNAFENFRDSVNIALAEVGKNIAPVVERFISDFAVPALDAVVRLSKEFGQLPAGVQNAALGLAAFAAVGGPALFVLGQMASSIASLVAAGPLLVSAFGAVKAAVAGVATIVTSSLIPAIGGLQALVPALAAFGFVAYQFTQVTRAAIELRSSTQALNSATSDLDSTLSALEVRLRRRGADISELSRQYRSGQISVDDYRRALLKLAVEYAPKPQQVDAVAGMKAQFAELAGNVGKTTDRLKDLESGLKSFGPKLLSEVIDERRLAIQRAEIDKWLDTVARAVEKTGEFARQDVPYITMPLPQSLPPSVIANQGEVPYIISELPTKLETAAEGVERFGRNGKRALQEISTVLTDLSRGIARSIIEWKGLGDVAVNVAKDIGQAVLRWAIQEGLEKLAGSLSGIMKNLPLLGGMFSKIGGDATGGLIRNGTGNLASLIPLGPIKDAGKQAASAVASSIGGIVNMATGIASAVSGIVGNFQMSGMNKSLDIIVKHTLQTANQLIYGLQPQVNRYLPALQGIHDYLLKMVTDGLYVMPKPGSEWGMSAAGGAGININISGGYFMSPRAVDDLADQIVASLRARGVKL